MFTDLFSRSKGIFIVHVDRVVLLNVLNFVLQLLLDFEARGSDLFPDLIELQGRSLFSLLEVL